MYCVSKLLESGNALAVMCKQTYSSVMLGGK